MACLFTCAEMLFCTSVACRCCCCLQVLGERTEGFSGSDINTVVKDVLMQPIRLLRDATHFRKVRLAAVEQCRVQQQWQQQHASGRIDSEPLVLQLAVRFDSLAPLQHPAGPR
jgi:SpoVK/Ycf46/Vps4 family AAA+-type ATPase